MQLWVRTTLAGDWGDYRQALTDLTAPNGLLQLFVTDERKKVAVRWGDPMGPRVGSLGGPRRLDNMLAKRPHLGGDGPYLHFSVWSSGHPEHDVQIDQVDVVIKSGGADPTLLITASAHPGDAVAMLSFGRRVVERWGAIYGLSWSEQGGYFVPFGFANGNSRLLLEMKLIAPSCLGPGWLIVLSAGVAASVQTPAHLENRPVFHQVSGPDGDYVIVQTAPTPNDVTDLDLQQWQFALSRYVPSELTDVDLMMHTIDVAARRNR